MRCSGARCSARTCARTSVDSAGGELVGVGQAACGQRRGGAAGRGPGQEAAGALGRAHAVRRQQRRGLGAHHHLAGVGRLLHEGDQRRPATRDEELAMGAADEEEVELAAVQALRHPQRHLPGRRLQPPDVAQHAAHAERRAARAGEVPVALEEQQEGVAAELQEVAAVGVGDAEQRAERRADRLDELLGALAAAAREALGELREPGDVREQQRGVERVDRGARAVRRGGAARRGGRRGPAAA